MVGHVGAAYVPQTTLGNAVKAKGFDNRLKPSVESVERSPIQQAFGMSLVKQVSQPAAIGGGRPDPQTQAMGRLADFIEGRRGAIITYRPVSTRSERRTWQKESLPER